MTSIGSARAELATASPESSDAGTTDRSLFIIHGGQRGQIKQQQGIAAFDLSVMRRTLVDRETPWELVT